MFLKNINLVNQYKFKDESELQKYLYDNPEVIRQSLPVHQIPQKLFSITREYLNIDNLYIDENGIPYLVEVKRFQDSRGRRSVLAQILDYGAIFKNNVTSLDFLISSLESHTCDSNIKSVELADVLADDRVKENFKNCLLHGSFKLIIISDEIHSSLLELCDYTFSKMNNNFQLFIVESTFYGDFLDKDNIQILSKTLWNNSGYFPVTIAERGRRFCVDDFETLEPSMRKDIMKFIEICGLQLEFKTNCIALYKNINSLYTFISFNDEDHSWKVYSTQINREGLESNLYNELCLGDVGVLNKYSGTILNIEKGKRLTLIFESKNISDIESFSHDFMNDIILKRSGFRN